MKSHIQEKLAYVVNLLKEQGMIEPSTDVKIMIENTKDKAHGDFATNLAMLLAKSLQKAPREVATIITKHLESDEKIAKTEIAGPGFINFFVNKNYLAQQINELCKDPRLGVPLTNKPQTIVVDYSSPNVAKEMAVHHIRSTVIGDAVVRILSFLGHNVIKANHIGDWGTQFGMLIAYLEKKENENANELELSDLEAFYREAKVCYDQDEEFAQKARNYVVKLQSGDEYCLKMWKKLVNITMVQNQEIYRRLNISLQPEDVMGESLYNPMLKPLVEDLTQKNLAVKDQGAMVVYLENFSDKEGKPRGVIVQKKDGGFLYSTTDIACTKYRYEHFNMNRMICFADSRQHEHLLMAWEIARLANYVPEDVSLEHGAFGMMLGKDGKPFKTRSGGTVKLKDLLDEAESRASKLLADRNSDLNENDKSQVIKTLAMGAVKYADLSKNRTTDYIFDWDNMLTFDGNTSPYLQYAYSRIQSIFKKTDIQPSNVIISNEQEENLAQKLLKFNEIVNTAAQKAMPHLLCNYLYELATLFMRFYETCPINKDDVEAQIKSSRLALCKTTSDIVKQGLSLLGIDVLDRM
jgi:arginyl-tRNA synthetase